MDTLSEITSHIGATTTTTDPSEIWISDLTGLFHMMNFVFTKRNFFAAIDIFCVDLFMQSHTILLLESDAVILHLGKREKNVWQEKVRNLVLPDFLFFHHSLNINYVKVTITTHLFWALNTSF